MIMVESKLCTNMGGLTKSPYKASLGSVILVLLTGHFEGQIHRLQFSTKTNLAWRGCYLIVKVYTIGCRKVCKLTMT